MQFELPSPLVLRERIARQKQAIVQARAEQSQLTGLLFTIERYIQQHELNDPLSIALAEPYAQARWQHTAAKEREAEAEIKIEQLNRQLKAITEIRWKEAKHADRTTHRYAV